MKKIGVLVLLILFIGCSNDGGSHGTPPEWVEPECVNEWLPCLLDDWGDTKYRIWKYIYGQQYEGFLGCDGKTFTYETHLWFEDTIIRPVIFVGSSDMCTRGTPYLLYIGDLPDPHHINGELEICEDILWLDWSYSDSSDTHTLEGIIEEPI